MFETLPPGPDMYTVSARVGEEAKVTEADWDRRRRFDALFREHLSGIASFCRWRSRSTADAEDAVAEVFLVAWRRLDDIPTGENARPWLYATARRVLADPARTNALRGRLDAKLSAQLVPVQIADDPLAARVDDALAALGDRDREMLLLAEWEG